MEVVPTALTRDTGKSEACVLKSSGSQGHGRLFFMRVFIIIIILIF